MSDIRVVIGKINVHGCLTVMQRRLETHVTIILIVFGVRQLVRVIQPVIENKQKILEDSDVPRKQKTYFFLFCLL
jgi:hypothetical protein